MRNLLNIKNLKNMLIKGIQFLKRMIFVQKFYLLEIKLITTMIQKY
jgi:hypothetical protein